jgi:hypothetical protein
LVVASYRPTAKSWNVIGNNVDRSKLTDKLSMKRNKTLNHFIILIGILFINNSCSNSNDIKGALTGEFVIEGIHYKDYNLKSQLDLNIIQFYSNGVVEMPSVFKYKDELKGDINVTGKWNVEIEKKKVFVNITTNNIYFNGKYLLNFSKDEERKCFLVYLNSPNVSMKCAKNRFNYFGNRKYVDNMIELTSGSTLDK